MATAGIRPAAAGSRVGRDGSGRGKWRLDCGGEREREREVGGKRFDRRWIRRGVGVT